MTALRKLKSAGWKVAWAKLPQDEVAYAVAPVSKHVLVNQGQTPAAIRRALAAAAAQLLPGGGSASST